MNPIVRKSLRWGAVVVALVLIAALAGAGWFYQQMRRSLPQLDGTAHVSGLTHPVTIERDHAGVPTIQGGNRLDVARALGWLHAQERYFQMDLLRRRAAGELAEIFGAKAVALDKSARIHGFRRTARENLALLDPAECALLDAYTAGVNAGLSALDRAPFEYLLLQTDPAPWLAEDSLLVGFAMALELHDEGSYERSLTALRDTLGGEAANFFAPLLTTADAALDGSVAESSPPMPSSRVIDLRRRTTTDTEVASIDARPVTGSNSFALSGAHTASGAPLLANDIHLQLRVPNAWYRASLQWPATDKPAGAPSHTLTGITLPGLPLVIAGSNGHIVWGFTNAYADVGDLVVVEPNIISRALYKRGDKLVEFEKRHELIRVKDAEPIDYVVDWTIWGPVVGIGDKTRPLAYRWTAHLPGAFNLSLVEMEAAHTTAEALEVAHRAGMPAQNILVADTAGHIAWSIAGKLPKRVGYDGRFPVARTYGDRYWDGLLAPEEIPVISDPASGRLWTANNRVIGEPGLTLLGDGGYDRPSRAARIRDRLSTLEGATPADLLAVQLDVEAPLLNHWKDLLAATLTPEAVKAKNSRAKLLRQLENWTARADVNDTSYGLVRSFRQQTANYVFNAILASCTQQYEGFGWHQFHYEQPLRVLLQERPSHLLNPRFNSWDELLLAAADAVTNQLVDQGGKVGKTTWGDRNRAQIHHPLARSFPAWLTGWMNLPADPLPGDSITPRVQRPDFGASARFVVSPGRESEGIFQMPGGQSGHPLSPFYREGHEAWVKGTPAPFLPGKTEHTLLLQP